MHTYHPLFISFQQTVAQQQLTANPNPANIDHNANYGPYNNPYANPYAAQNPYANPAANYPNPGGSYPNPAALQGGYPGLLNMAASQQYPIGAEQQMGQMGGLGGMNYDYLNDPFMY